MSLTLALQGAISGVTANQQAIALVTQNITNANTDGYTRQVVKQARQVVAGTDAGVKIEALQRVVDEFLLVSARTQSAKASEFAAQKEFFDRIQFFFGQPGFDNDLNASIDRFFDAFQDLTNNPEQPFARKSAIDAATNLTTRISTLARDIEKARFQVDQEMVSVATEASTLIEQLYTINLALDEASKLGTGKNALLDERDGLLDRLIELTDFNVTFDAKGAATVFTGAQDVLTPESRSRLSYVGASSESVFIDSSTLNAFQVILLDANGKDTTSISNLVTSGTSGSSGTITNTVTGGYLKGLVDLRDTEFPKILDQLDMLADTFADQLNKLHNNGSGFPPRSILTGTRSLTLAQDIEWTGEMRMAVIGTDGKPLASPYSNDQDSLYPPLKLNLEKLDSGLGQGKPDVQTIIDEINEHYGPPKNRLSLGPFADIKMTMVTDSNNAAGTQFDFEVFNNSSGTGTFRVTAVTFSDLNVTLTGGIPTNLSTGVPISAGEKDRTTFANVNDKITIDTSAGTFPFNVNVTIQAIDSDGNITNSVVTYPMTAAAASGLRNDRITHTAADQDGTTITPSNNQRFATAKLVDANGNIISAGSSTPGFLVLETNKTASGVVIDELTSVEKGDPNVTTDTGTSRGFSHYFELNNLFIGNETALKNAAINLNIRSDIKTTPERLSTGRLSLSTQPTATGANPLYTYELGAGSNQAVQAMAELRFSQISFTAAGTLPAFSSTFGGYGAEITGFAASQGDNANNNFESANILLQGFNEKIDSVGGVNVDEELANSIVFQNAFSAAARMISVIDEMFGRLMEV